MLRLTLAIALVLVACRTETIELAPDAGIADSGAPDAGPGDAGDADATPPVDSGPPDTGDGDAGPLDIGPPDTGPPDTGVECVCRYVRCSNDPECVAAIGVRSTCEPDGCTGAVGTCRGDPECGAVPWSCTAGPDVFDPCP